MGFSRQEDWSGLPCPPPGDLPKPGIESEPLTSPTLAAGFFTTITTWEATQCFLRGHPIQSITSRTPKALLSHLTFWLKRRAGFRVQGLLPQAFHMNKVISFAGHSMKAQLTQSPWWLPGLEEFKACQLWWFPGTVTQSAGPWPGASGSVLERHILPAL